MHMPSRVLKIVVVVTSLSLVTGYLAIRSGALSAPVMPSSKSGRILHEQIKPPNSSPADEGELLNSSKAGPMMSKEEMMASPKAGPIDLPSEKATAPATQPAAPRNLH